MFEDFIYIKSSTINYEVLKSCHSIIAAFLPGKTIKFEIPSKNIYSADILRVDFKQKFFTLYFYRNSKIILYKKLDLKSPFWEQDFVLPVKESLFQIQVKRALYLFLEELTSKSMPWGVLTGIRPGKLVFRMEKLGVPKVIQESILQDLYMVSDCKIKLLSKVIENQKNCLERITQNKDGIALYISIPFCPSRCFYCSFSSRSVTTKNNRDLLAVYLKILNQEIKLTGLLMKKFNLKASEIYIGGGTPTVLTVKQLESILQVIKDNIDMSPETEYTIEAGRPDTLDNEKMVIMKEYNVNRISINPQSMQDRTLEIIGRTHKVNDIVEKYYEARNVANWIINMDVILGLPGEGFKEVQDSLDKVLQLRPDNVTVHALALKKGSIAWDQCYVHENKENWLDIQHYVEKQLTKAGFNPYYLYRQKNIIGNLENIGYALSGKECLYNIVMIEETKIILGLGAGATSKIFYDDSRHKNIYSSNDINFYLNNFKNIHNQKERLLTNLSILKRKSVN